MKTKQNVIYDNRNSFIGIYDFSYAPFALGDAITWQMNLLIGAIENCLENVVQFIVADPLRSFSGLQPHINKNNYIDYLNNLFPAFLCCPIASSIHLIKHKNDFDLFLLSNVLFKHPTWPSIKDHFNNNLDLTSHKKINKFFNQHNYLPRLMAPKSYENSMQSFLEKKCMNRFVVAVNIRNKMFYPDIHVDANGAGSISRDSPLDEWLHFFRIAQDEYPDVIFLILGGYFTWARELYNYNNVIIPRTMGLGLAHELTLLHNSKLFMGTSSGFSAMATFSKVPYIITNVEHRIAGFFGLSVGASRHPFALDNQILNWEKETTDRLLSLFGPMYEAIRSR
jgi:hypothetical protein